MYPHRNDAKLSRVRMASIANFFLIKTEEAVDYEFSTDVFELTSPEARGDFPTHFYYPGANGINGTILVQTFKKAKDYKLEVNINSEFYYNINFDLITNLIKMGIENLKKTLLEKINSSFGEDRYLDGKYLIKAYKVDIDFYKFENDLFNLDFSFRCKFIKLSEYTHGGKIEQETKKEWIKKTK